MKIGTFMRGMVVGVATGVLLDTALRPSPKFRKTQAGTACPALWTRPWTRSAPGCNSTRYRAGGQRLCKPLPARQIFCLPRKIPS